MQINMKLKKWWMNGEEIIDHINNGKNLFNKFDNLWSKGKNIEVLT